MSASLSHLLDQRASFVAHNTRGDLSLTIWTHPHAYFRAGSLESGALQEDGGSRALDLSAIFALSLQPLFNEQ